MTDTTSAPGTLPRTGKQSDMSHPHYFSSFQNYCSGPKSKITSSSSKKNFSPIPEKIKQRNDEILSIINSVVIESLARLTQYTSVLPFEFFEQDRIPDGQHYLVDRIMCKMMIETRVINWMPSLRKLYPVRTSGNGNCLLHAVLIAMAGVHDFNLNLRDRLLQFMHDNKEILKASWKTERLKTDKMYGIQSEDPKLDSEWEELCDLVRYENSDDGQATSNLQFLEGVHIFSLSNMLARPIIILSEDVVRNKHGEAISYNDLFGIYLPILTKAEDCAFIPIVLAYDQSHFCPLQTSDKKTGSSSDNYLPLYQSLDHVQDQNLLPIRFLGNDSSTEQVNRLLQTYLRTKILSHYPEPTSTPVSVRCAELGSKHFNEKSNYFLVYYAYLEDFFETQKRKLQQQEEERRRRERDYYSNDLLHDINPRLEIKTDISSSSPPPAYSSVVSNRTNDTKTNSSHERRSSYDKALANGTLYESYNDGNRSTNQYSTSQNYSQPATYRGLTGDNSKPYTTYRSDWDSSIDEYTSGTKPMNISNSNPRGSDSRLRQEQTRQPPSYSVSIPIHFNKSDSPSNLIDFEQKTDGIRPCIMCKHYFNDYSSIKICSDCDYKMKHPVRPSVGGYNTPVRIPLANIQTRSTRNSDFITPLSTSLPRVRDQQRITCPKCRQLNVLYNTQNEMEPYCSICKSYLYLSR